MNEILVLLTGADEEAVRILVNELGYSQRLKTADVLFARAANFPDEPGTSTKNDFHMLITELQKLGERRNDLVHSKYMQWHTIDGFQGLIRQNSKLRGSKGIREEDEEELLPESFAEDLGRLDSALQRLEAFRLKIIDWLYPDEKT